MRPRQLKLERRAKQDEYPEHRRFHFGSKLEDTFRATTVPVMRLFAVNLKSR